MEAVKEKREYMKEALEALAEEVEKFKSKKKKKITQHG